MTEIGWRRLAWLLLRTDARGVRNMASHAPGSFVGPALFGLSFALPLWGLFMFLRGAALDGAVLTIIGAALPWAFLGAFGPARWPGVAQVIVPHLPTDDRAVYAHSILRMVNLAVGGILYGCLPLIVVSLVFTPDLALPLLAGLLPLALAFATAAAVGRRAWGLVAGWSARAQLASRLVLAIAFSLPAFALVAGASLEVARTVLAPFLALATMALSGFPTPSAWTALSLAAMLAIALACAASPVRTMPPRATPLARAMAVGEQDRVVARTTLPRSSPSLRRPSAPFPFPRGPDRALRYLSRQWLKVFVWFALSFGAIGLSFLIVRTLFELAPPPNLGPLLTLQQMLGIAYGGSIGLAAAASFPGLTDWTGASARKTDAERIPVPASLRVGPPVLMLKRWSYLQTLPFSRATMDGAFLRPLLFLLLLTYAGLFVMAASNTDPLDVRFLPWLVAVGAVGAWLGGAFVGRRSNVRHARDFSRRLSAIHSVSAGLWLASATPLSIVGIVGILAVISPFVAPPGAFAGLGLFLAGAVLMPFAAYALARERLVAAERPWESPERPLWLAAGALAFCVTPVALIVFWLMLEL